MKAIPSTIHSGYDGLTVPLHVDVNQKIMIPKHDFSSLPSPKDQLHIQQILPDELVEYFQHVANEIKENKDHIVSSIQDIDWTDKQSIMDGLQPILDFLKPVLDYVKAHPWILIPLLIPVLELFIGILGFGAEGVVLGSIAATLQSRIGNVKEGSLFSFFQSAGAGGWAFKALQRTNMLITIAVIIVALGEFLIEHGIIDPDEVMKTMRGLWNREVDKFDPPVSSVGSQVMVLNLNGGLVRYGLLAWLLMYGAVCTGEGGVF